MAAGTFDRGAMTAGEVGRASQANADLVAGDFDLDVDALAVGEHNAEEHDAAEHDAEELDSEELAYTGHTGYTVHSRLCFDIKDDGKGERCTSYAVAKAVW